jgi:hypothetical protein
MGLGLFYSGTAGWAFGAHVPYLPPRRFSECCRARNG